MVRLVGVLLLFLHGLWPAARARRSAVPDSDGALPRAVTQAAATITQKDFFAKVSVMAHDSMFGRDTPSAGLDMTADWIAAEFRRMGLKPGGEGGTFLQHYTVQRVVQDYERSSASSSTGAKLEFGRDLGFFTGHTGEEDIEAPVVLLSGGLSVSTSFAGGGIRGNHVLLVLPSQTMSSTSPGFLGGLLEQKPASVLLVVRQPDAEWSRRIDLAKGRVLIRTPWREQPGPPILTLRAESLHRLLDRAGLPPRKGRRRPADGPVLEPLGGLRLRVSPKLKAVEEFVAPNVVGILEGRDQSLRNEYLIYSGHMDHLGVGVPDRYGDSIYNGADDSASGTATMLEVAEAFALLRPGPRRSVILLAVSGEEKGLWGSTYFALFPPIPRSGIVADLNAGMVGRNSPDTIVAIGKEYSDLGATLARVSDAHPELGLMAIDDPWPDQRFFERSDHLPFAGMGVPALSFFSGTHQDYHRPGDELQKLDLSKSVRVARLLFYLGCELAEAASRPRWHPEKFAEISSHVRHRSRVSSVEDSLHTWWFCNGEQEALRPSRPEGFGVGPGPNWWSRLHGRLLGDGKGLEEPAEAHGVQGLPQLYVETCQPYGSALGFRSLLRRQEDTEACDVELQDPGKVYDYVVFVGCMMEAFARDPPESRGLRAMLGTVCMLVHRSLPRRIVCLLTLLLTSIRSSIVPASRKGCSRQNGRAPGGDFRCTTPRTRVMSR